eukprot:Selendium_serpulae@DN6389_c1_g1_i4.p2
MKRTAIAFFGLLALVLTSEVRGTGDDLFAIGDTDTDAPTEGEGGAPTEGAVDTTEAGGGVDPAPTGDAPTGDAPTAGGGGPDVTDDAGTLPPGATETPSTSSSSSSSTLAIGGKPEEETTLLAESTAARSGVPFRILALSAA